jgi:hypothetical protein
VPGDLHLQVARDREHRDRVLVRVGAQQEDRVGPRRAVGVDALALVRAEDQESAGATGVGAVELRDVDRRAVLQRVGDVLDLADHRDGHGGRGEADDQQRGQPAAQRHLPPDAGRLVVLGCHAAPSIALNGVASRVGMARAKPVSSCR